MTYSPQTWLDVRTVFMEETKLPPVSLGIQHYPNKDGSYTGGGGYHAGNDLLAKIGRVDSDYSKRESARDRPGTDGASAIDIGWFDVDIQRVDGSWRRVTLRDLGRWTEANWNAPDMAWCRECIYSLDGSTVKRLDRLGVRTSGDHSHDTHNHYSGFRDDEGVPKAPAFRRFFREMRGGERDMDPATEERFRWFMDACEFGRAAYAGGPLKGREFQLIGRLDTIIANQAADKTRDEAHAAVLQTVVNLIQTGGGDVDTATLVNAVNVAASATKDAVLADLEAARERARKAAQAEAIVYDSDPGNDPVL